MKTPEDNTGKCLVCGAFFEKKRFWQKFCCKKHQVDWNIQQREGEMESLRKRVKELTLALEKANAQQK